MLDSSIPLTEIEWEEVGNPNATKEMYEYMLSYSPYDNIVPQVYPNALLTGGLHDPRVGYWEPTKMVAKLRDNNTGGSTMLLKMDMGAGHFSVTGRFEKLKEVALEYVFMMKCVG